MNTQQIRNKVANIFFGSIIIAGLFMSYGAYYSQPVQADSDIISNKPASYRRLNSNGYSQKYIELSWSTRDERAISLLLAYWFTTETRQSIKTIARIRKVQPEIIICISYADSSLGKHLKTQHNYWNVNNNDRGNRQSYDNLEQWFNAIGKALNNKYLSYIYTLDYLSRYHNKDWKVYATSAENHFVNTANCLSMIHNKQIQDDWNFRW